MCVCCVAFLSRTWRLVSVLCSVWSLQHSRSKFLAKRWAVMFSKRRKVSCGSWEKSAPKKCWRTPSRSASFVPIQMSGQGGDADDAIPTSRQGCGRSTDRQFRRELGGGRQDHRHPVVE